MEFAMVRQSGGISRLVLLLFLGIMCGLALNTRVLCDGTKKWVGGIAAENQCIRILQVRSCDKFGNPRESFYKGFPVYFTVTVNNTCLEALNASICVTVCDSVNVNLGVISFQATIPPETSVTFLKSFLIPKWAYCGTGKLYANALTPEGTPYCPEESDPFSLDDVINHIRIFSVCSCDAWGNPRDSFYKGFPIYFTVTVNNTCLEALNASVVVAVCDGGNAGLGEVSFEVTIPPEASVTFLRSFPIPEWACYGTGKLYANALTSDGTPYCPEECDLLGVKFPGDVDDSGFVDGYDATTLSLSWWVGRDQPNFRQEVDFDVDGFVSGFEATIIGINWWTHVPRT